jgi:NAD(P)-dependent dehydrogenase (short-subunit alcohol dehydrogenase family)
MADFNSKVVLVTGAAGALGRAVVDHFAARGAQLAQLDVAAIDNSHYAATCDLSDLEACRRAVGQIVAELGTIDALANIAGGFKMGEAVHETSAETWDLMLGLNAGSVLNMARVVVPQMLTQGGGRIVNVGAAAGLRGAANMGAYSVSKSAVIRLTEAMSAELKAQNIRVNCILPTVMDTPRNRNDMPNADFAKWVTPAAMAEVIGFLASDAAGPIHGAALPVAGLS